MLLAAAGLALGVTGSLALSRFLAALLFGVSPVDPVTFGVAALVVPLAAFAACWLPARRAASGDPMTSLRVE
jgi:ABC-type antimicrobial peptide transport system permease subunit